MFGGASSEKVAALLGGGGQNDEKGDKNDVKSESEAQKRIKEAIGKATSLAEVQRLERILLAGGSIEAEKEKERKEEEDEMRD